MNKTVKTQKRGDKTREQVIGEAAKLFYLNGYKDTTMRSLASAAGIQHPSLFSLFQNKGAIASVLLMRYYNGLQDYAEKIYRSEVGGEFSYTENMLVFYALNYILFSRDERIAHFYTSFYAEEPNKVYDVTVSLKNQHESKFRKKEDNNADETTSLFRQLDYQLLSHITIMLIDQISERLITPKEAAIYFASKKIDFQDRLWDITLEDVLNFYGKYWDMLERQRIDVYRDLLTNSSYSDDETEI